MPTTQSVDALRAIVITLVSNAQRKIECSSIPPSESQDPPPPYAQDSFAFLEKLNAFLRKVGESETNQRVFDVCQVLLTQHWEHIRRGDSGLLSYVGPLVLSDKDADNARRAWHHENVQPFMITLSKFLAEYEERNKHFLEYLIPTLSNAGSQYEDAVFMVNLVDLATSSGEEHVDLTPVGVTRDGHYWFVLEVALDEWKSDLDRDTVWAPGEVNPARGFANSNIKRSITEYERRFVRACNPVVYDALPTYKDDAHLHAPITERTVRALFELCNSFANERGTRVGDDQLRGELFDRTISRANKAFYELERYIDTLVPAERAALMNLTMFRDNSRGTCWLFKNWRAHVLAGGCVSMATRTLIWLVDEYWPRAPWTNDYVKSLIKRYYETIAARAENTAFALADTPRRWCEANYFVNHQTRLDAPREVLNAKLAREQLDAIQTYIEKTNWTVRGVWFGRGARIEPEQGLGKKARFFARSGKPVPAGVARVHGRIVEDRRASVSALLTCYALWQMASEIVRKLSPGRSRATANFYRALCGMNEGEAKRIIASTQTPAIVYRK